MFFRTMGAGVFHASVMGVLTPVTPPQASASTVATTQPAKSAKFVLSPTLEMPWNTLAGVSQNSPVMTYQIADREPDLNILYLGK